MELQQTAVEALPVDCETAQLERARDFIYQTAGLYYSERLFPLLLDRCHHRMSKLDRKSLEEYVQYLTSASSHLKELKELLHEIMLGGACFYEHPAQLEALVDVVLPQLLKQKRDGCSLRIWSAGCSTGEDPYSIAMLLMERGEELLQGRAFEIIATHPEPQLLQDCTEGIYGHYALRNLPAALLEKYFRPVKKGLFQVNELVKAKISFQKANLLDDSKLVFLKGMDVIFCRNVLKGFSPESKLHVLQHFHHNLFPDGYLFLGQEETLFGVTDDFALVHFTAATGYIKKPRS